MRRNAIKNDSPLRVPVMSPDISLHALIYVLIKKWDMFMLLKKRSNDFKRKECELWTSGSLSAAVCNPNRSVWPLEIKIVVKSDLLLNYGVYFILLILAFYYKCFSFIYLWKLCIVYVYIWYMYIFKMLYCYIKIIWGLPPETRVSLSLLTFVLWRSLLPPVL